MYLTKKIFERELQQVAGSFRGDPGGLRCGSGDFGGFQCGIRGCRGAPGGFIGALMVSEAFRWVSGKALEVPESLRNTS